MCSFKSFYRREYNENFQTKSESIQLMMCVVYFNTSMRLSLYFRSKHPIPMYCTFIKLCVDICIMNYRYNTYYNT